jgi:hypothetical protein
MRLAKRFRPKENKKCIKANVKKNAKRTVANKAIIDSLLKK